MLTVTEVKRESTEAVTLFLRRPDDEAAARGLDLSEFAPGRFFMVWLPRLDEKPYALAYVEEERLGVTVQKRGPFSTALCELKPGAKVGLRGPFGRGFWGMEQHVDSSRVVLIGGGCGMAVLAPLTQQLPGAVIVQGARYTCGPEEMMARAAEVCRTAGIGCQAALERYMKCGIGVCGQCDCDGRRVCVEGPGFSLEELAEMPSFGRIRRDKTGGRVGVGEPERCPSAPQMRH